MDCISAYAISGQSGDSVESHWIICI